MAIELSLDTVDQLAQDDYADVVIPLPSGQVITLVHPLRMEDERREKFADYFKDLQAELDKAKKAEAEKAKRAEAGEATEADEAEATEADLVAQSQELLSHVVLENADDLFAALGRDVTRYQTVVKFYFEQVQPGEA